MTMTAGESPDNQAASARRSARLRLAGVIVLLAGVIGAALIYWTRPRDMSNDLSMVGFNRAQRRQMGQLYGRMGMLVQDWSDDLKRPDTQAALVLGGTIIVAAGCFYFARLSGPDDMPGQSDGSGGQRQ